MSIISIILFAIYSYGLGYTLTKFIKNSGNFLERNIIRIGIGLGSIPLLGVFLNLLHIPIDWKIFLVLSLILPTIDLYKYVKEQKFSKIKLKIRKSDIYIIGAIILFLISLYIYTSGAFKYGWLEDDDPWHHAASAKYVATQKNINPPDNTLFYLNPYAPGYAIVMGLMHQTSSSLYWTLKFFNALIVSLSILFFFFFAKHFSNSGKKALFATFVLASLPCYLSHFIWAHSLVVTLLFPALYCIEMLKEDKRWVYPAVAVIASICMVQPTQPIKFAVIFAIYFLVKWISSKKFNLYLFISIAGGYLLSLLWWFNHWQGILEEGAGGAKTVSQLQNVSFFVRVLSMIQKAFPPTSGTATRPYTFNEMIFAQRSNMINNPIGIGWVASILILIGFIYALTQYKKLLTKEKNYLLIALLATIFTFLGFNTLTFNLPIGLFSFRFWMLFAIFASLLAAEGFFFILVFFKNNQALKIFVFIIIMVGIILTSAHQKYSVNTSPYWSLGLGWAPIQYGGLDEVHGYIWMRDNLPPDSTVFAFINNIYVLGFDMYSCEWCQDINEFRKTAINESAADIHNFLKNKGYDYLIVDARTVRAFGQNKTNEKLQELIASNTFRPIHQEPGTIVMHII